MNHFFTDMKKKEFSLILLSGRKITDIIRYLIMQYGGIFVISNLISIVTGKIILELMTNYLLTHYQIVLPYNMVFTLGMFFLMDALIFIYIMLINFGTFIRLETKIVNLMSNKVSRPKTSFIDRIINNQSIDKTHEKKHNNLKKALAHFSIVFIMILSLIAIFFKQEFNEKVLFHTAANICLVAFINLTIPYLFDIFHKRFFRSIILLVSCSNIMYMIKSMIFIINLSCVLIPVVISFMVLFSSGIITQVYIVIYILIIMIMLFLSMIFKLSFLMETKHHEQQTLQTLGINSKQLNSVKRIEFNIFYFIAVILPMLFSFLLLYSGIHYHIIEINFAKMIIAGYVSGAAVSYLIMYGQYRKIYRKEQKHGRKIIRSE